MKKIILLLLITFSLKVSSQVTQIGNDTTIFKYNVKIDSSLYFKTPSNANPYGVIYKNNIPWLSDFSYGWNGTVTVAGNNIFLGKNAGNFTCGSTATSGSQASNNIAIGTTCLYQLTTGYRHIAIGFQALNKTTGGLSNVAVGNSAGYNLVLGTYNVALGYEALYSATSSNASNNIAIGREAVRLNNNGTPLIGIGYQALYNNTTGTYLIGIGKLAGSTITGGATANTTSDYSIYIGDSTRALSDNGQNEIVIGYKTTGNGSNTVTIGNSSIVTTYLTGNVNIASGARYLRNGIPIQRPLADFYTDASTSGIGETDLYSYTVPANTLANNGDKIIATYTVIGDATATGHVEPYFAETNLASDLINVLNNDIMRLNIEIIRVSSSVARCTITAGQAGNYTYVTYIELTSKDWTTTNILKITGTAAAGTITAKMGYVEYKPVAQ